MRDTQLPAAGTSVSFFWARWGAVLTGTVQGPTPDRPHSVDIVAHHGYGLFSVAEEMILTPNGDCHP